MGHNPKTIFVNKTIYNIIELRACVSSKFHSGTSNREEKSFRHVALVTKLLDHNKPKINLQSKFALFQICSLYRGFAISRSFFIYFAITGVLKKIRMLY